VTRTHPGQPRPYTGIVNIVSGEVAEDLATYLVRGLGLQQFMRMQVPLHVLCFFNASILLSKC
jgi:redox-regulated HSP33 family molecular chaperone